MITTPLFVEIKMKKYEYTANDYISTKTSSIPIILKPKDVWKQDSEINNSESLKFYESKYSNLSKKNPIVR